jgi:SM-20-related protein
MTVAEQFQAERRNASYWCDIDAFRASALIQEPFPYTIVPRFIRPQAMSAVEADFPAVTRVGSFPLPSLKYGPAFGAMMDALRGPEFTSAVEEKFAMSLSARPTMVTVRGSSGARDGHIHTDSVTKLITALIYMNSRWESPGGRLRLLRSPDRLDDVIAEVPPDEGTLLIFKNAPNAWHGYEPFHGTRRVIQLNWVTSDSVVWWEQTRHRVSAMLKGLRRSDQKT